MDDAIAVKDEIKIERARRIRLTSHPAKLLFDVKEKPKQVFGCSFRINCRHGVEEFTRTWRTIDWRCFVESGSCENAKFWLGSQSPHGGRESGITLAEVRAERNVCDWHNSQFPVPRAKFQV
jgi:hypothetical protein